MYCIRVYLDLISLSGLLIVLVGLGGNGLSLGSGSGSGGMAAVRSGFMNLLFLVYTPLCIVLRLYELPSPTGHCTICAGVHTFLFGSSCTITF